MPGLSRSKIYHSSSTSTSSSTTSLCTTTVNDARNSIWSRSNTEDVSFPQLQKFWNELPADARRNLLRIDKQTLFEQVRKNLYCSRCHGLLVEGFSQIVMYGKNLSLGRGNAKCRKVFPESELNGGSSTLQDDARDPSLHPWGGLAATRDCMLTVLDCFLDGTSLEVLQNVFECARGRERERELLYPDACGGNGRGWISQTSGIYSSSGRGHGMKETCALHTARLSCEALVDFWSALSEETRRSLLRMKEEDFIERLMFRFDSKRFCRDCRRNVLREFKEMKELKRARKEPRCTRWFCAADTTFQYEVSDSAVQADWHESFAGEVGTLYQHFEWALGTAEGKADIFGFEDVGLSDRVEVEGLDLGSISDCFITIRAWRRDGRCIELSAKAHALKGELCVHRRLFVGDGIVSITEGESIQRFFEHAEETEEEEDEDAFDKDGNELDGEGTRSQKHAKSPELARDFLLDAATVIFKEQVEKAFREGTARQNAHSIFVCLALGLLEDRVRVACKEIATLEKQNKLLEEEEHEKREEEERRERRKLKEKEKKLRRKEKLKSKERDKDKSKAGKSTPSCRGEDNGAVQIDSKQDEQGSASDMTEVRLVPDESETSITEFSVACTEDSAGMRDGNGAFIIERSKAAKRRSNGKRQQIADSAPTRYPRRGTVMTFERVGHRVSSDSAMQERQSNGEFSKPRNCFSLSRQDTQCACSTTLWVKGQQLCSRESASSKLSRKADVLDSRQIHAKAGIFKGRAVVAVTPGVPRASTVEAAKPRKEGLSYTKVVTKGWNSSANGVKHVQENGLCQPTDVVDEAEAVKGSLPDSQMMQVEAVVDEVLGDELGEQQQEQQQEPASTSEAAACPVEADEDGTSSTNGNLGITNENMEAEAGVEAESHRHCPESPTTINQSVKEDAPERHSEAAITTTTTTATTTACSSTPPAQSSSALCSLPSPAIGSPYGMVAHAPPVCSPEVVRNGYVNGFVQGGPPAGKNPYTSVLPVGQIRHPPPVPHLHHHHPAPQPAFACYPVHGPWGPHQSRSNFIPPMFIPGPAFGYPRYPVPRMFHPPMRVPEMVNLHSRPSYAAWMPVDTATRPATGTGSLQHDNHQQGEGSTALGEPMQTAAFSLQQAGECVNDKLLPPLPEDSSGFSLFHFGGPNTGCNNSSSSNNNNNNNGAGMESSDSPTSAISSSEANEDEVVVSSKCMDRLPSGINKPSMIAGEYSLFAAAPGKGFGFF